jgi:hypothetical protein
VRLVVGHRVCEHRSMLLEQHRVPVAEFETGTGWALKPQGACRGDVCVPLAVGSVRDGEVDVVAVAERLGMPLIEDADAGLWALGPETSSGRALPSAEAPELVLSDLDGNEFRLSSLRGQKVVIVSWAPY